VRLYPSGHYVQSQQSGNTSTDPRRDRVRSVDESTSLDVIYSCVHARGLEKTWRCSMARLVPSLPLDLELNSCMFDRLHGSFTASSFAVQWVPNPHCARRMWMDKNGTEEQYYAAVSCNSIGDLVALPGKVQPGAMEDRRPRGRTHQTRQVMKTFICMTHGHH
jgi:hypothetical protein